MKKILLGAALTAMTMASSAADYKTMDILDFQLDKQVLQGQYVTVTGGHGFLIMGSLSLSRGLGDFEQVFIDVSNLPREDRKALALKCKAFPQCKVDVSGRVEQGDNFIDNVTAHSVKFR